MICACAVGRPTSRPITAGGTICTRLPHVPVRTYVVQATGLCVSVCILLRESPLCFVKRTLKIDLGSLAASLFLC